ncbi:hypothetical protein PAPYR_13105 [Paratrimastix pyriformis]|uniref:Peptidase A2 domain-containing protein n=1 Tax=Paratrimastix pyriformis TaxID=342808 RepID=A0ABQ8U0U0_9EUKA|nr:hypothetical protein PAPYR_13105 [Paratrimastix pyriformis]
MYFIAPFRIDRCFIAFLGMGITYHFPPSSPTSSLFLHHFIYSHNHSLHFQNLHHPPTRAGGPPTLVAHHPILTAQVPGNRYTMSRQKFATILLPSKIRSMKPEAFVSPLPSLPRLRNILNFEECVRFEDTISQTIGSIDGLPVDLRQLVPPSAVGILLRYNQHCFDSCEDLFDSLYDISRPKSNFLRTRLLASLVFSPPPTSEQIAFSLEEHIWKFLRFVDGVPPTPVGPVTSVVPAGTPAPSASVVATTPCSGAATTAVTFPSFGKLDPQLTTTVVVNGVSAPALLDTGAMISVISPAFAHDLALPVVEDGPVRSVLLADGSRTSVQRFSPVTLRLSPECKPQQAVLYHLGRDPLILVGLSELRGHGLVLGDTPTITPLNIPVGDDDNDLGDDDYGGEAIVGRLVLAGPLGALDSDGQPDLAALALAAPRIATLATPPSGVSESPPVWIAPAPDQPHSGKAAPTLPVVRRDVLTDPEAQQVTDLLGEYAHLFGDSPLPRGDGAFSGPALAWSQPCLDPSRRFHRKKEAFVKRQIDDWLS